MDLLTTRGARGLRRNRDVFRRIESEIEIASRGTRSTCLAPASTDGTLREAVIKSNTSPGSVTQFTTSTNGGPITLTNVKALRHRTLSTTLTATGGGLDVYGEGYILSVAGRRSTRTRRTARTGAGCASARPGS